MRNEVRINGGHCLTSREKGMTEFRAAGPVKSRNHETIGVDAFLIRCRAVNTRDPR